MAVVKELLRKENNGAISFGDYSLASKTKLEGFEFQGDLYKVKTFKEITKLEKNEMFLYESVPGTAVENFKMTENEVVFEISGVEHAQFTLGLAEECSYEVFMNDASVGEMSTNMSGKLSASVDFDGDETVAVRIVKR